MSTLLAPSLAASSDESSFISAEEVTHRALFNNVTDIVDMMDKEQYREYLVRSLNRVNASALAERGTPINVTSEDIVEELKFWEVKDFIWPSILYNHEGGVVFLWAVYDDNIRFERYENGTYGVRIWNNLSLLKKTRSKKQKLATNPDIILGEILPAVYAKMIRALDGQEWKSLFA